MSMARKKATARKTATKKTAANKTSGRRPVAKRPTKPAKRRGMSLHIGLNAVDPKHYAGWSGELFACENDARDMAAIATAKGMTPTVFLTRQATRDRVLAAMRSAAKQLRSGDLFFLTYSGHGGQVPDVDRDEPDHRDETWCLYDGELIDDELYLEMSRFAKGVRILMLSDSCHSGTVARAAFVESAVSALAGAGRPKWMPREVADKTYEEHKDFYDRLQRAASRAGRKRLVEPDAALAQVKITDRVGGVVKNFGPVVILISGCMDNQTSMDGDHNGAFTEQLLRVWNRGTFDGTYPKFHAAIKSGMRPTQSPNLFSLGEEAAFLAQHQFQV
jgi:hypothetical protein